MFGRHVIFQGNTGVAWSHPRRYWETLDRQSKVLAVAVAASLTLHALLFFVRFGFPDALRWQASSSPLEVVLVNSKTKERPDKARALAQSNLAGGGNTDEARRATSALPVTNPKDPGRDLADAQRRVQELEAQQQRLLAQAKESSAQVAAESQRRTPSDEATPKVSGRDLADLSLAAMRLQAQIDKQTRDYNERPKKRFIGANTTEYRFAQYEEDWRTKIERVGTLHYPPEAKGKLYGVLRLTVTIRPDGSVDKIDLDKSSGLKILDEAAFRIVQMASPFAAFPADIRKDTDLIVITRSWIFDRGDRIWTQQ